MAKPSQARRPKARPQEKATGKARPQEKVTDIVGQMPAFAPPKASSFLEWSGTIQMAILLVVICVVVVLFLVAWWCTRPTLADLEAMLKAVATSAQQPIEAEKLAQTLSQLQRDHTNQFRDLFQIVVMSGLVPLFTLLAGYVFGKSRGRTERKPID